MYKYSRFATDQLHNIRSMATDIHW